ncbi:ATP-binding cassette domain-containing protein [Peribacillus sp. NJ4]|uniref:ATP-binding cassette domain-containing protein n=1 Tax=Peribacillus TaxID=2675229 RepID=UPI0025A0C089|nr:ATP-binding cassette domain-containing protein [Peribacillus sp. NJ4]MDM5214853.1 ATP-binding cassette domain-containing protein [Peribacillus sp. NJ4]
MLHLCEISKEYSSRKVFDHISLKVPSSSIVTVTGKNGIGKTTLLNIIGGISKFQGDVLLEEISLKNNYKEFIKLTTLIPNDPFLYDYLTVIEMIDLVISLCDADEKKAKEFANNMLLELELLDFKPVLIKNLSLGTKQKVAFITAFINTPKLVLIDEPFVNFDRSSMGKVLKFIKEFVTETGAVVIFSTHSEEKSVNDIVTHNIQINASQDIFLSKVSGI